VDGRAADVVVGVEEGFGEQGADVAAAEAVDDTLVCALVSRSSRPNRRRRAEMGRQFFDDAVDPGVVVDPGGRRIHTRAGWPRRPRR
jgi:hypothetical protein